MSLPILSCDEITQEFETITKESKDEYLEQGMEKFMKKISLKCREIKDTRSKRIIKEKINEIFDWFSFCEKNIRNELFLKHKYIKGEYPLSPLQRELCKKEVNFLIKVRGIIDQKKSQFTQLDQMV